MLKKIHSIMINIGTFALMALLLFIPMFTLKNPNGDILFQSKTIFGYHFITGYTIKNGDAYSQVLMSKLLGMMPVLMLLSIFVIDKLVKANIGKDIVNFLCLFITLAYIVLLPINSSTFITENYLGYLEFEKLWGFWLNFAFVLIVFIYYIFRLVLSIIEMKKEEEKKAMQ